MTGASCQSQSAAKVDLSADYEWMEPNTHKLTEDKLFQGFEQNSGRKYSLYYSTE